MEGVAQLRQCLRCSYECPFEVEFRGFPLTLTYFYRFDTSTNDGGKELPNYNHDHNLYINIILRLEP